MTVVPSKLQIISPEVLQYGFGVSAVCGAFAERGAVFADIRAAFEFSVTVTVGCGIA